MLVGYHHANAQQVGLEGNGSDRNPVLYGLKVLVAYYLYCGFGTISVEIFQHVLAANEVKR